MASQKPYTIFDRPRGLRFIGLAQMLFGFLGLLATAGILYAWNQGIPDLVGVGHLYAIAVFTGVAIPCLIIGNYVDDLRRWAVMAQFVYSVASTAVCLVYLYQIGLHHTWEVHFFEAVIIANIGFLAATIAAIESIFAAYLIVRRNKVLPPPGVPVERDRRRAAIIRRTTVPTPLTPHLLAPDGKHELTPEEERRVLKVRKATTTEGMAILCSNCDGAIPISEIEDDNTVKCGYCGVRLAVGGVFVPCENHKEYVAATTCSVCGGHYCRRCLTAQAPPVDPRWQGSTIFLCQKCFEGRYRPAVTTTSLVIPIGQLFHKAGGRFSKVGRVYRRFLGMYARVMRYVLEFAVRMAAAMAKSGGKGSSDDNAGAVILVIIIIIVAIPVAVFLLMLAGAIVIIPILFYAGLVGVAIEAVRMIRRTDFITLDEARQRGVVVHKPVTSVPLPERDEERPWQQSSKTEKVPAPAQQKRR